MFTKTLATALVSGLLLGGAMTGQSFANDGGGDGPGFDWARMRAQNGATITSRANRDGSHTIVHRDPHGKLTKKEHRPARKVVKVRKVHRKGVAWASSYDRSTGRRVTSIGNGDRTRTVITFSPFGFSIGISR